MPKGVEQQQLANSGTGQTQTSALNSNASNIFGGLEPTLQAEAAHGTGYTPAQKALQNTAAQQSAGGATAGAVGQGGLYAARSRNAGGAQAAIGDATRGAGANLSRSAVGTEVNSANLANQNQQRGIGGLSNLYGEELGGGEANLGLSNQALQGADQSAANNPWMKLLQSGIAAGGQVGAAAAGG